MPRVDDVNPHETTRAPGPPADRQGPDELTAALDWTAHATRRLVRVAARTLREDLFTLERDPLPPMSRPRWLARLPHVLVFLYGWVATIPSVQLLLNSYQARGELVVMQVVVQAAALLMAMSRPVLGWWLSLGAAFITQTAVTRVGENPWPWTLPELALHGLVLLLLALRVRPRVAVEALVLSVGFGFLAVAFNNFGVGYRGTAVGALVYFGLTVVIGSALRARRVARTQLVEQTSLTAEERARRTLLEERSRIARELHDVVAHHMSVISIQAQVAPHLVENPSEELKENLAGIRENALEALTELRRVLGVLRSESAADPANPHHPQPTLADLGGLVDNVRGAGLDVTTEIAGVARPLTPGVELTAYRIVQEALSNCLRHAPGSEVEVGIAYGPRELHVCVANSAPTRSVPPSPGAGHGLLGMRERAGMLGGELAAGPRPSGGYEVTAVLPMDTPARTTTEKDPV
ncbi:sensor histidine kinase [Streptomyces sp. NPDC086023]|uniref:sensor histidine kinase n=1 Tax=Streptomyces sp. NPDC086023 TaxID=3365746 RepID=UPI0037CE1F4B